MFLLKGLLPSGEKMKFSGIIIVLIACIFILRDIHLSDYNNRKKIIEGDVLHYYAYLPALLVYNDLKLEFVAKAPGKFSDRFWPVVAPNGKYVIMTTMGMSVMYAPFIIPTHYFLKITGQEAEGYSKPYKIALLISAIFYVCLALFLIRKILLEYFSDTVTTLVLLSLALGTNLIHYATREAAFSHAYSFFLITLFLFSTVKYYKKPGFTNAIMLGLSAGMIVLVRPTNIIVFIILPLWGIASWSEFKARWSFLLSHWKHITVFALIVILTWVPQFLYWKMTTGEYFFNGYGDGGKFFFNNPQFANILFSYRKGWLIYTPLMLLTILGFINLYKTNKGIFYPVLVYFILNTYVLSSWWLWWYGGSYGNRAFIDMYGVLSFPLAAFFTFFLTRKILILKIIPFLLSLVFIAHNLFQLEQYQNGAIHFASMTKEAYWDSFGNLKPSHEFKDLLVFPDYKAAKVGFYPKPEVKKNVINKEQRTPEYYEKLIRQSPKQMKMMEEKAIIKGISIDSVIKQDAKWLYKNNK
jgi:hypothetical protein